MADNTNITLSGNDFVVFPKEDHLYPKDALGVSFDLSLNSWADSINTQIIGNHGGQGWGLFLENGRPESYSLFIVDAGNDQLLKFNNDCSFSLQRSLDTTQITAQTVDTENNLYIFDQGSGKVFIFDQYGVETNQISVSDLGSYVGSVNVIKVVGSKLYILFEEEGVVSFSLGDDTYQDIEVFDLGFESHNNFEVLSDGSVVTAVTKSCSPMKRNCNDEYFHIHGVNLYKNGSPFFYIGSMINSWLMDEEDNITLIYQNNRVLKINSNGLIIFDKVFHAIQNGSVEECDKTAKNVNISQTKILTNELSLIHI